MTKLLLWAFIKNRDDVQNPAVRRQYGLLSGAVGIVLNLLLTAGKLAAGLAASSIAVMADAFNNLTDAASSVVTLVGFHLAGQKADEGHPFGHGRMEYLSGLVVSLLILLVGLELGKSSVEAILHPAETQFSLLTAGVLLASVLVKLWMCLFNRSLSRRIAGAGGGGLYSPGGLVRRQGHHRPPAGPAARPRPGEGGPLPGPLPPPGDGGP